MFATFVWKSENRGEAELIGRLPRFRRKIKEITKEKSKRRRQRSNQLFSFRAPVSDQTDEDQKKRAAGDLGFIQPDIRSLRRRDHGDDHGKKCDRQTAQPDN